MARKIKKGSYWRTLQQPERVLVALQDGWSNMWVNFATVSKDNSAMLCRYVPDLYHLYRCKKNGEWFGQNPTEAQRINRDKLSLEWQAKGAIASLCRALDQAGLPQEVEFLKNYTQYSLYQMGQKRKHAVQKAQQRAAAQKEPK